MRAGPRKKKVKIRYSAAVLEELRKADEEAARILREKAENPPIGRLAPKEGEVLRYVKPNVNRKYDGMGWNGTRSQKVNKYKRKNKHK